MTRSELSSFLDSLAARTPAPGAGSAAAAVVAMAAALVEMTARFSDDEAAASAARTLRARAVALRDDDAAAYAAVLGATGKARQEALSRAADVPLAIAQAGRDVCALAASLRTTGNANLRGEATAAVELASAGARAAAELVLINLAEAGPDERVVEARELLVALRAAAVPTEW